MQRNSFYDEVRGFAIFLVVLGHVIQTLVPEWNEHPLFLGIYMFHMPLFAFLSGVFFARSSESHAPRELISRRFMQLMVPCLIWGLMHVGAAIVGKLLHHKPMDIAYFVHLCFNSLWYLSTIFELIVIGIAIRFVVGRLRHNWRGIGWFLVFLALYAFPNDLSYTNQLQFLCPFFAVGDLIRERRTVNIWIVMAAVVVFAVAFHFFSFEESLYGMGRVTTALVHFRGTVLRLAGGVSGIVLSFAFIELLTRRGNCRIGWLAKIGTLTLPIYVLHGWVLKFHLVVPLKTNNFAVILFEAAIVILLTLGVYFALSKSKILAFFLLGERRRAKEVRTV